MKKVSVLFLCCLLMVVCLVFPSSVLATEDQDTETDNAFTKLPGDLDGDLQIDNRDVEYLLWHTLFPEDYPLSCDADYDEDGAVDNKDVEYLLWHTLFPDDYPLPEPAPHVHSYSETVTAPTATKEGYTTYTCSCGDSYTDNFVPAVGIGELKFSGASLVLKNDLSVRFSADANLFVEDAYTQPYAVFNVGIRPQTVTEYEVKDGKYIFTCTNIAPSQAGDTITAALYATLDGEQHSFRTQYSAADYCYNMLEKTDDPELRTLLVDLLNYGAAAQTYAWYKDNDLCNARLTEEQKAWGTSADPVLSSCLKTDYAVVEAPKATWLAAGLVLDNSVMMRFRFETDSIDDRTVKIVCGSEEWVISEFESIDGTEGQYYAYFQELTASQMRDVVYVTVYEGSEAVSNTLTYSIETYAYNKQNEPRLNDLLKSMMRYGDSASGYGASEPLPDDEF